MRKVSKPLFISVLCFWIAGCNIHPTPFDVTGYRTVDIVKAIRCEAKRALDKFDQPQEFKRQIYDKMTIGYKFTFTTTENNNLGGNAILRSPISHGNFSIGVGASTARERLGIRDFTFVDRFKEARAEKVCEIEASEKNHSYPITGVIGLEEVIRTYLELQAIGLGELPPIVFELPPDPTLRKKATKQAQKSAPTYTSEFVETFEFTTTLKGGLTPKIELQPAGSGLSLAQATGDISGSRSDRHAVIITLAPNYNAAIAALANQDLSTRLRNIERGRFVPIQ